ncbi:LuxR C-terminal-related transcriptional regulator [Occultella aeris]|uniref:LuxR C-terminal-related transcriptional regulator n=1 Tax=Occultella aeris TaxID=2761496 RepID=UPI0012E9F2D8|nr:LuxR C-terminal-related transcriptional regulator [Occultella aeris]
MRLLEDLNECPVLALVAPAGAGKTALAADWITHTGRRAIWLALDDADRDPQQLTTALAATIDQLAPGCADSTMSVLRRPHRPEDAVHALVDVLEDIEADRTVLVIDDVHLVDDDASASSCLAAFIEHKPAWLDLLVLTRRRLRLPVDRFRASGLLADLSFEALRFSDAEAMAMLVGLCPDAAPDELSEVAQWAGGWAAALQLSALAVRSQGADGIRRSGHENEATTGSGRLVDEYLWHEVLRAERPEMISLLLGVSVADRVNYSLAEALTDSPGAGEMLAEAERRGLFVTALEPGGWFEVHGLVRDLLRAELGRRQPERLRDLHARAARWFEATDDSTSAVEHWLSAGMPREALRLLAELAVDLFDGGRASAMRRMTEEISPSSFASDPEAMIEYAWCQMPIDRQSFQIALAAAQSSQPVSGHSAGRLEILRAAAAIISGDWHRCEGQARAALDAFDGPAWLDSLGRFGWSLVARGIALDERWFDGGPEVEEVVRGVSHDPERAVALEGTRAVALALGGYPLDAVRTAARVRPIAEAGDMGTLRVDLALADAIGIRELGDHGQARQLLEDLSSRTSYPNVYVQFLAQLELVELHLSEGALDCARSAFRSAAEICEYDFGGRGATDCLARRGVVLGLACREPGDAAHWARQIEDPFWRPVSDARVLLAAQRRTEAAGSLALAVPRCARHQVVRHLLLGRSLHGSDRGSAEKEVAAAAEIAAEHGMLETVGDSGRDVLDLLELAAWRVPDGWMRRLRHVVSGGEVVPSPTGALVAELTVRERGVLRLLPTRLTLHEIADQLFISHNTVKFHLRVIYQKLGVNSRAEAVATARRLSLMR